MEQKYFTETDYDRLTLTNDFIFGKVMQNERNCIDMLERLTGNHIDVLKKWNRLLAHVSSIDEFVEKM